MSVATEGMGATPEILGDVTWMGLKEENQTECRHHGTAGSQGIPGEVRDGGFTPSYIFTYIQKLWLIPQLWAHLWEITQDRLSYCLSLERPSPRCSSCGSPDFSGILLASHKAVLVGEEMESFISTEFLLEECGFS